MNPLDEFILSINKLQINDHAEMTKLRINTNPLLLTYVNNPHTKYNMKTTPTETPVNHNNIQLIKNFKQFMNDKAEQDLKRIYGK
jgi:myosin-crossreactive antigen